MELDKNSQQPLYMQLMKEIKEQIQNGYYKPGDQIPTENQLSELCLLYTSPSPRDS